MMNLNKNLEPKPYKDLVPQDDEGWESLRKELNLASSKALQEIRDTRRENRRGRLESVADFFSGTMIQTIVIVMTVPMVLLVTVFLVGHLVQK